MTEDLFPDLANQIFYRTKKNGDVPTSPDQAKYLMDPNATEKSFRIRSILFYLNPMYLWYEFKSEQLL